MVASFLLALLLVVPQSEGDEAPSVIDSQTKEFIHRVTSALSSRDKLALIELTDFRLRMLDGAIEGSSQRLWEDMEDIDRRVTTLATTGEWTTNDVAFLYQVQVWQTRFVRDPQSGKGFVPNRQIVQVVLRNPRTHRLRDILVTFTPDHRLLDITFGDSYVEGKNPDGPAGLIPQVYDDEEDVIEPTWDPHMDPDEILSVRELIDALIYEPPGRPRELAAESLHRNPKPAVTALLERLISIERFPSPDREAAEILFDTLSRITGRTARLYDGSSSPLSQHSSRYRLHADVVAWSRWYEHHGSSFAVAPIGEAMAPTASERGARSASAALSRWARALERRSEPTTTSRPSPSPQPDPPPQTGSTVKPSSSAARVASGKAALARSARALPPSPRMVLYTDAADIQLIHQKKTKKARDVEGDLSPEIREVLNQWASVIKANDLRVVVGENPSSIVLGKASDQILLQASTWLDETWTLLDPIVPLLPGRQEKAAVALLFDEMSAGGSGWTAAVDLMESSHMIFSSTASALRAEINGLMLRSAPLFLQLTWDNAGDASAGDDEFRLRNEICNKFAQCLLTTRAGQMPAPLRWGLGYLAEIRATESVYTFDHTGFVAVGDHFDWPGRTRAHLKGSPGATNDRIIQSFLNDRAAGQPLEDQMIAWATLDFLSDHSPQTLQNLMTRLAKVHSAADPRGRHSSWRGEAASTEQILATHLSETTHSTVIKHLDKAH